MYTSRKKELEKVDRRSTCLLRPFCSAWKSYKGLEQDEEDILLICPLHGNFNYHEEYPRIIALRHCYAQDQIELWERLHKGDLNALLQENEDIQP